MQRYDVKAEGPDGEQHAAEALDVGEALREVMSLQARRYFNFRMFVAGTSEEVNMDQFLNREKKPN